MGVTAVGSEQSTATADSPPVAPARGAGVRSLFRPARGPARAPAPRTERAARAVVAAPAASELDDLFEAWTSRIERGRPGPRRARRPGSGDGGPAPAAGKPQPVRDPDHYLYSGTVSLSVGPFDDLAVLGDFTSVLRAIPGVAGAVIQTFDRDVVVFEVVLAEPVALIPSVRDRSFRALRLLHANERIIRLKLV